MSDPVFAWRAQGPVTRSTFLRAAREISASLPSQSYLLNIASDRYHFALGLVGAWMAGCPTLLPSDQGRGQLTELVRSYPDIQKISDAEIISYGTCSPTTAVLESDFVYDLPGPAVIPFTSGTTGDPVPHAKSLLSLKGSAARINQQLGGTAGVRLVATVPPQHMYGLELTLLLPLFEDAILDWRRPFFPGDILAALRDGPSPVALVTTPLHLRALLSHPDGDLPKIDFIVSATAPLPIELAREAESRFAAPLHEIYGCTELGSIAGRRPVSTEVWTWYSGIRCAQDGKGHCVSADHVDAPALLSDHLEILTDVTFLLKGRNADLVNIAGKRASIRALERVALSVKGVEDVAFIQKEEDGEQITRLAALVVLGPEGSLSTVKATLRRELDPAFVPRILLDVPSLPRNALGKIPRSDLLALMDSYTKATR